MAVHKYQVVDNWPRDQKVHDDVLASLVSKLAKPSDQLHTIIGLISTLVSQPASHADDLSDIRAGTHIGLTTGRDES